MIAKVDQVKTCVDLKLINNLMFRHVDTKKKDLMADIKGKSAGKPIILQFCLSEHPELRGRHELQMSLWQRFRRLFLLCVRSACPDIRFFSAIARAHPRERLFSRDRRGVLIVEYALIAAITVLLAATAAVTVGNQIPNALNQVSVAIQTALTGVRHGGAACPPRPPGGNH